MIYETANESSISEAQAIWDSLVINVKPNTDSYPVRRKKFAKVVKEVDMALKARGWRWWTSWTMWDEHRLPLTYCFTCGYPQKPVKTVSPQGELKMIRCPVCDLVLYDSRHDNG